MKRSVLNKLITKYFLLVAAGIVLSLGVFAQTYTTQADGNWSSPATWVGGVVPNTNISAGRIVNIKHMVTVDQNSDITIGGTLNVVGDTLLFTASYNKSVKVTQGGLLYVKNGGFVLVTSSNNNDLTVDRGRIDFENAIGWVSNNFQATKGATRTIRNSKLYVGGGYDLDGNSAFPSIDTIQNALVEMGMINSGDFRVRKNNTLRLANAGIKADKSAKFINEAGATIDVLPGATSKYGFDILRVGSDLQNDGNWNARIDAACIGGSIVGSQLAAIDFTRAQDCGVTPSIGVAPELVFVNAVLKSGVDKKQGAIYRFANVKSGIDAEIKLKKFSRSDIVMQDIDVSNTGWDKAFQPQFGLAGTVAPNQNWYIDFELKFYKAGTNTPATLPKVDMTALDVDGDGVSISEYASFQNPSNVIYSTVSYLAEQPAGVLGQLFTCPIDGRISILATCLVCGGDGKIGVWNLDDCAVCNGTGIIYSACSHAFDGTNGNIVQGPVENFVNIDTAATQVMSTFQYTDVNTIDFRYGGKSAAASSTAGVRLNSLWARQFNLAPPSILPVQLSSFAAFLNQKNVDLNWTSHEENFSHYIVQRSADGKNFSDVAVVMAKENTAVSNYKFTDVNISTASGSVFYRLRMVDKTNEVKFSDVRVIRLTKVIESIQLTTYPNPVTDQVRVSLPATWQGKRVVLELYAANGVRIQSSQFGSASQTESIEMTKLTKGSYIVRAICGSEVAQQPVVKN